MSAFITLQQAEQRARALEAAGIALEAHEQRDTSGVISVRLLRPVSKTGFDATPATVDGANQAGAWDVVVDDSET